MKQIRPRRVASQRRLGPLNRRSCLPAQQPKIFARAIHRQRIAKLKTPRAPRSDSRRNHCSFLDGYETGNRSGSARAFRRTGATHQRSSRAAQKPAGAAARRSNVQSRFLVRIEITASGWTTAVRDRTTFVVAHRLSTLRNATRILVLEGGPVRRLGQYSFGTAGGMRSSAPRCGSPNTTPLPVTRASDDLFRRRRIARPLGSITTLTGDWGRPLRGSMAQVTYTELF